MAKGSRLSEKWFQRGLWIIALVFAGFLIGLGSLVVGNLPHVDQTLNVQTFMDQTQLAQVGEQLKEDDHALADNQDALDRATTAVEHAKDETNSAHDTFTNWIQARSATQQSSENAEVIRRTQQLDTLKANERKLEAQQDKIQDARNALQQVRSEHEAAAQKIRDAGTVLYDSAQRRLEMHVFLIRLALTLPLLLISALLFFKARKSSYWPFVWGFIFFSFFAFFVELVPYLPSYGGYVRYIVGIVVTVFIGVYAIRALNRYLERQRAAEQMPEQERRKDLNYDLALSLLNKKACPGCERPLGRGEPKCFAEPGEAERGNGALLLSHGTG